MPTSRSISASSNSGNMKIPALQRLTTDFDEVSDRLCLSGEITEAPPAVMWLTQRLALRLLPHLFGWLDRLSGPAPTSPEQAVSAVQNHVVHSFAQETARATLIPQPAVEAPVERDPALIHSVDLAAAEDRLALVFRTADGLAFGLALTPME